MPSRASAISLAPACAKPLSVGKLHTDGTSAAASRYHRDFEASLPPSRGSIVTAESQYARFGSGKSVPRVEDEALLTGAGRFADDFSLPGQAYVCFLRSPHAHARIEAIDSRGAAGMPGVIAIVTGDDLVRDSVAPLPLSADFKRADGSATASPPRHALAVGTVRFVGEAVAAVIAQSAQQARDAVEAIDVRYDQLPAVTDGATAVAAGAPQVWPAAS